MVAADPMAVPHLTPAKPKALDSVCSTTKRGYVFTKGAVDGSGAKSTYASSTTTIVRCSLGEASNLSTVFRGTCRAVGLPGEQRNTNRVLASTARSTASTSTSKVSGSRFAVRTCAEHRGLSTRSERPQNRKVNHPRPRLMDTSRIDGVKAPQNRGTPRSHCPSRRFTSCGCG